MKMAMNQNGNKRRQTNMEQSNFWKIIEKITEVQDLIEAKLPKCRENSLALTKLDEAEMWLRKGNQ